ncbi:MAG: hypothetical protein GY927_11070 [bacterium]|nr:hypothetical protein [bacterium]
MQKLALLILLLFTTVGMTSPQKASPDVEMGLERALAEFRDVSLKRDVAGIMSFYHPGLFTHMPKEQVSKAMSKAFADGQTPTLASMEFHYLNPVRPYSRGHSALIGTLTSMTMQRPGDVTPEIDALMIGLIKRRMGDEVSITVDEKKDVILIGKKSWLLAINEGGAGWKFIEKKRIGFFIENNLLSDEIKAMLN